MQNSLFFFVRKTILRLDQAPDQNTPAKQLIWTYIGATQYY